MSAHDPSVPSGNAGQGPEGGQPSAPDTTPQATTPYAAGAHTQPVAGQEQRSGWASPSAPTSPQPAAPPYSAYGRPYGSQPYAGGYGYGTSPQYGGHGQTPDAVPAEPASKRGTGRMRMGVAGLVLGALIGGGAGAGAAVLLDDPATTPSGSSAAAQTVVIEDPQTATTATAAAAKAAPSVVTIYVTDGSNSGSGSGVVLSEDGYVLTNNHVVTLDSEESGTVQVRTSDGTLYDATVVGTDPSSDLAVVQMTGAEGLTPAEFADSDEVQVGDVAVAIGAPLGLSNTVTDGIISATQRAVTTGSTQDETTVIDALQTDAAINPGNSGGALVNGAGEVIGINTAIATVASGAPGGQAESGNIGVGFAIPSNSADRIAQELIEDGSASRALLGVTARTEGAEGNSQLGRGAGVVTVEPGGAAEDAGLREGDVITAVDDRPVTTSTELTAAVRSKSPGDTVTLSVRRGNDTSTVDVTLGSTG